jgi:putative oxidoreductase
MNKLASITSRLLMSLIFIISGWGKLTAFGATVSAFSSLGIPLASLVTPLSILIELGGGLALLGGFKTRSVAGVLAVFTVIAALIAHNNFADQNQAIHFLKNLAIAGGLLLFVKYGGGGASIDERMSSKG